MNPQQLISPFVPILEPTDTGNRALFLMDENNLSQLPLVVDEKYIALVREEDLFNWEHRDQPLSTSEFLTYRPAFFSTNHPFDALKLFHQQHLEVLPMIDNEKHYFGSITTDTLLQYFAETTGVDDEGGVIVLEVDIRNYSLAEISRITEAESVSIVHSHIHLNKTNGKLEVTLKTNKTDLSGLIASLERYSFQILKVFGEQAHHEEMMDRYQLLMNYLNM
jgi:predicted transcriptional regulator